MSYRLINANEIANKYPEVNDMPCIYADLPNGMDGKLYNFHGEEAVIDKVLEIITIRKSSVAYDKDKAYKLACDDIEHAVLALKEGEQE